jgi:hypothetical protein
MKARRGKIWAALAAVCTLACWLPAAAFSSPTQFSILQDDSVLLGESPHLPDAAMEEANELGVDTIRTFVTWNRVAPNPTARKMPGGFRPEDPESPGYRWGQYDALIDRARQHGMRVIITLTPGMPYWGSDQPRKCPHHIGGRKTLGKSCMWKPDVRQFGAFAAAVARRYGPSSSEHGGNVAYYAFWNEPNLEHYLYPQFQRSRGVRYDFAARRYRELWIAGWRSVALWDRARIGNVLFGDTAAISSPMDTLYAALCLDEHGKPFKGRLRALQGCKKPKRLQIGGVAVHPYNSHAAGTVFTRSFSGDSLAPAYLGRLHRLLRVAERTRRIPRGRGIFITEFGFQSAPPERKFGLSLNRHAGALNEAERLFFADSRVKSVSQFELYDVPAKTIERDDSDVYTTGLRFRDGAYKPAFNAWRLPLVVTKLGRDLVEVWGMARPANGSTTLSLEAAPRGSDLVQIAAPRTNTAGYFRIRIKRKNAERLSYRIVWRDPLGVRMESRVARAGARIRYLG